ncbi:MAG: ABC transporter substrate-binding protein [Gammaproteobacteria bacterium]
MATQLRAGAIALGLIGLNLPAVADVELTFRFNDPDVDALRASLDEFESAHPDIKVTLERIAWGDAREQFLREAAVGEGPDVAQIAFVWPRSMGLAGALAPLNELIQRDGVGKGWEDFVATDLAVDNDQNIYGVPWTTDTFAFVYNKDLFAEAGIDAFPTTWEGLREASKQIHVKTGKSGWGFPAGSCGTPSIWFFLNYRWWSMGQALVEHGPHGKFVTDITAEQIAEGFDYYNQYLTDGHNSKEMLSECLWGSPKLIEGMARGDMAMASIPGPVFNHILAAFEKRNPGKAHPFASAIHPAGVNGSKTHLGGRMLGINVNSEHPEEAWKLVQHLTQLKLFTDHYTAYVPAQKSLIAQMAGMSTPEWRGFNEQLEQARSWGPYSLGPVAIPTMWNAVGRAAGSVFIGEKRSIDAAKEVLQLVEKELAKGQ